MNQQTHFWHFSRIWRCFLLGLLLMAAYPPAPAASLTDIPRPVSDAAVRLVQYCNDSKTGFDEQTVATLVDYVLTSKNIREYSLPESNRSYGAYFEFDTKIAFPRFMAYSYSSLVPAIIARPSSLRYSIWSNPRSDMQKMPASWSAIPPGGAPVVIRGMQHDSDTPDLTTGVYHEYGLKRTLILLNHGGRQVLISISKQIGESNVGKKGVILGNDNDWTYFYSNEPGTMKTWLGWAKSYIYDYFSVAVYAESGSSPPMVRAGAFQWLRAGWSGINFVKPGDILGGLKRYARNSRMVLESPRLPAPSQLASVYRSLSSMPASDLVSEYAALQQALRSSAIEAGKISKSEAKKKQSFVDTSKEQMVEELMLEYLKRALGKPTPLGNQSSPFSPATLP
ncbi:MAG: hypothetical protein ABSC19_04090 [Syntrophorhabdales bacterium]